MAIRRYTANSDTCISNAFQSNLRTRMTGSNFGAADILELFSIAGQASTSSVEVMRILTGFPISTITADRNANKIPASGSVNFFLRMFNAPHAETLPRSFTLMVQPVSRSWESGFGIDMEEGTDITRNGTGANWIYASSASLWAAPGGDYLPSLYSVSQSFDQGYEDLQIDVSTLVESWISGTIPSNGIGVFLTSSQESSSISYYTKRFFSSTSEFFFKRPILEARWDSSTKDERQRFFVSSSLLNSGDNQHTIYLYNYYGGQLKNIPSIATGSAIYVQVWTSASNGGLVSTTPTVVTGGYTASGTYSASFAINTTASVLYDIWYSGSSTYHTGIITASTFDSLDSRLESRKFVTSITNLKPIYDTNEVARIRLFNRMKGWQPNIYTIASNTLQNTVIDNAFYKILRIPDNNVIIDYGTSSLNYTKLSYDGKGNFFDFDFSLLEPNYSYAFRFMYLVDGNYEEDSNFFKFRVTDN